MEKFVFCGGPAGINVVDRPSGPLHYSRIDCSEFLLVDNVRLRTDYGCLKIQEEAALKERDAAILHGQEYKASSDLWATRWSRLKGNFEKLDLENMELKKLIAETLPFMKARQDWKPDRTARRHDQGARKRHLRPVRSLPEGCLPALLPSDRRQAARGMRAALGGGESGREGLREVLPPRGS